MRCALALVVLLSACAPHVPPVTGPIQDPNLWHAARVVLAFESLRAGIIGLNRIQRCDVFGVGPVPGRPPVSATNPPPTSRCVLLVSNDGVAKARQVIDATIARIRATPTRWRVDGEAGLVQVRAAVGMPGSVYGGSWIRLVEAVLKEPVF